jgi:hypothetical protein
MDEMDTLDILIKLEFPAFPSDWRLGNYLLSDEQQPTTEVIFRFSYDKSVIRYGLGAISALFLPKLSYQFEESSRTKTDYDISSLWGRLVHHFNSQPLQFEHSESIIKEDVKEPTWVDLSIEAIKNGDLKLSKSGVGGTYFTSLPEGKNLSVFKPIDEEPGGPNNPKKEKLIQSNFTPMLPWGTGANREVAAYHIGAFAGVPETHFIETEMLTGIILSTTTNFLFSFLRKMLSLTDSISFHFLLILLDGGQTIMKKGSLQKFVSSEGDCSDFGSNKFSIETIHRLGIFDICILNMDRNDENLLLQKGESESDWRLVPIDHTYDLSPSLLSLLPLSLSSLLPPPSSLPLIFFFLTYFV